MKRYRPGGSSGRSFAPGVTGSRSFSPAEPRSVSPMEARRQWRGLCEAALACAAAPEVHAQAVVDALKVVGKTPFPLMAGDVRGLYAAGVQDQMRLFTQLASGEMRRRAAPLVEAGARYLADILIEQGADLARAGIGRIDPGEREG